MASSNYVGARSIEELAAALEKFNYTPRTEAERRTQSENLYRTQLNQALRNAQQTYEESDLALANQLIGLDTGYDRQRQSQEEAIRSAISEADRRALSRGMQRSTYNNATLANLQNKGNEALARIEENRANDRAGVEAQRAQLSRNLARTREGANADFQSQVIAAMQNMENEDYQRKLTADQNNNNTQLQLYASQQAEDQFAQNLALKREQMAQEQKQFEDQMWYNREKEGLGWSTAEDAKKAAAEAAANAAKGVNGTESPNGTGTPGLHVTGYSPGYDSVGSATGAGTGTGNTNRNNRRKTPTPTTSTTRDWSASFNGNNLTTPLKVTAPASTPLISGSGITRNVSTVHSTLNLPNQPDKTTADKLVKKSMR